LPRNGPLLRGREASAVSKHAIDHEHRAVMQECLDDSLAWIPTGAVRPNAGRPAVPQRTTTGTAAIDCC